MRGRRGALCDRDDTCRNQRGPGPVAQGVTGTVIPRQTGPQGRPAPPGARGGRGRNGSAAAAEGAAGGAVAEAAVGDPVTRSAAGSAAGTAGSAAGTAAAAAAGAGSGGVPPPGVLRCDVLEMPAEAGWGVLRGRPATGPVALTGGRMRFLIAEGGAAELPGLLDWLEWGGIPLDLSAAPAAVQSWPPTLWLRPPGRAALARLPAVRLPVGTGAGRGAGVVDGVVDGGVAADTADAEAAGDVVRGADMDGDGGGADGAAVPARNRVADRPDLVRLVSAAATACHRLALNVSRSPFRMPRGCSPEHGHAR